MTTPYKIHVKLGGNEFEAEGSEAVLKEQFQLFLEAVKAQAQSPAPATAPASTPPTNGGGVRQAAIERETLEQVFLVDPDGQVSLRVLPQTPQRDSDGVLLLLYGYRAMSNQMDVLSGRLLAASQTSGLNVDRIDRALGPYMDLVTKGGVRAGSRWGLRNTGVTKAEEIIRTMVS